MATVDEGHRNLASENQDLRPSSRPVDFFVAGQRHPLSLQFQRTARTRWLLVVYDRPVQMAGRIVDKGRSLAYHDTVATYCSCKPLRKCPDTARRRNHSGTKGIALRLNGS